MMTARLALLAVALVAGVGWRLEVEWRGWAGLNWAAYFHWAVPAGAVLFAAWLRSFGGARWPWRLAGGSLAVAAGAYVVLFWTLMALYSRWVLMQVDIWVLLGLGGGTFWLYPVAIWALGRHCGAPIRVGSCVVALGLWAASVPLAIGMLDLLDHVGGADFLHAIKSGVVIPPLLVSLGLPFVWSRRGETSDVRDPEAPIETARSHSPG